VRARTARVHCGGGASLSSAASPTATRRAGRGGAIRADTKHSAAATDSWGAFNLSLILRKLLGAGTPREWKNRSGMLLFFVLIRCSPAGKLRVGSSPANRQSHGQNTSGSTKSNTPQALSQVRYMHHELLIKLHCQALQEWRQKRLESGRGAQFAVFRAREAVHPSILRRAMNALQLSTPHSCDNGPRGRS
jgi:hypothetical protein